MAATSGTELGLAALCTVMTLMACGEGERQPGSGPDDPTGGNTSAGGSATGGVATGGAATGGSGGEPLEPVRVIRGDPEGAFMDLTIRGEGLDDYEGKRVLVRIGWPDRLPERLGSGEARIEDGAFELFFPAVWEQSLYKIKLALIDLDGDGGCDLASDLMFSDARAVPIDALVVSPGSSAQDRMLESQGSLYCGWYNEPWPEE